MAFLDAGSILYVGPGGAAESHAHHAVQLVWSSDAPFTLQLEGRQISRRAALIPAHAVHSLDARDRTIALLLVEAHGSLGIQLDARARALDGAELTELPTFPASTFTSGQATAWSHAVVARLGIDLVRPPLSSVSRRAIAMIESTREGVPRIGDIAARLGLSATRLTHVFTREVGMPFRRFVLWARIKRAVTAYRRRPDLTSAAIAAGFADAAHFSRTFRAMFGLRPSLVLPIASATGSLDDRA